MNRVEALAYLDEEYRELAVESEMVEGDRLRAYHAVIDQSLRHLDFDEADIPTATVDASDTIVFLALLDYFVLRRYTRIFSLRINVSVGGAITAAQSMTFAQVKQLCDEAMRKLSDLGISFPISPIQVGRFNIDILEPTLGEF